MATSNLKDDLASLRIDSAARARRRPAGRLDCAPGRWSLALAGGGWFWSRRVEAADVKTATVTAQTGAAAAPGAVLNASGYVTARRRATVSSKVTGKVLEVFVEEGKEVRSGQVLARLDDSQIRAALAVAHAQLEPARRKVPTQDQARLREAELTLQRRRQLLKEKVIGRAELDASEAEVESLKARIALAQQQVEVAASPDQGDRDRPRRHGRPRAVRRRGDLEGRAARRDDLSGLGRRRLHPHRHLHHRGHVLARDRGGRQRELHQPRPACAAGRSGARRVSGLADSRARHHDGAVGRSAEGDRPSSHRLRDSSSPGSCPTWASRCRS